MVVREESVCIFASPMPKAFTSQAVADLAIGSSGRSAIECRRFFFKVWKSDMNRIALERVLASIED